MTTKEREFIAQRENLLPELLEYFEGRQDQPTSQSEVVKTFRERGRADEELVVSGIWRLLDMHRIDFDKQLSLVLAGD